MILAWRRPQRHGLVRAAALSLLVLGAGVAVGAAAVLVSPIYAVGGALVAGTGLLLIGNLRLSILALIAVLTLLPFGVAPVGVGGVRPTFVDITLSLVLVTMLVRLFSGRDEWRAATPADVPLALFLGISAAAFVLGTSYAVTAELVRQYLKLINSTMLFFVATQVIRTRGDLRMVVDALVGGGTVAAGIGIGLYHLEPEAASTLLRALRPIGYPSGNVLRYIEDGGVRTDTLRAIGTSVDPNVFGALLIIVGGLAVGQALEACGAARLRYGFAAAVASYALLVTLSRGSWLGFATAVGIVIAVRHRRLLLGIPLLVAVAAATAGAQLTRFGEHFLKAIYAQDQATGMRLGEYKDALTLIWQNPFLGVGFGAAPSSDLYLGVSSTYLLIAEETGLLGLTAFLVVIASILREGWRRYNLLGPTDRPLALTALAVFCGLLVAALVDRHFFDLRFQHVAALFWLVGAIVVLSGQGEAADNKER